MGLPSRTFVLVALLLPHAAAAFDLLLIFRMASRNTRGFRVGPRPQQSYVLPQVEFLSVVSPATVGLQPLLPTTTSTTAPLFRIVSATSEGELRITLTQAVHRCMLAYGLFEILAAGDNVPATVAKACALPPFPTHPGQTWRAGVVVMPEHAGDDDAMAAEKQETVVDAFWPVLRDKAGLDPALETRNERGPAPDLDVFIFVLPGKQVLLCRRLAAGPAVGKGYTYATTPRRPRGGVLKALAKRRTQALAISPTAMEPELGWVLCNVAGVREGSKVLDPFVGGGSLLLAARLLGAVELVGTDAAEELVGEGATAREAILEAFEDVVPTLAVADIATFRAHPSLFPPSAYDTIVTDPPYDIKAKVRGGGKESKDATTGQETSLQAIGSLLMAAAYVLKPGGRLVFFLPSWGKHAFTTSSSNVGDVVPALPPLPLPLHLVTALPQVFSSSFTRWLVCIEKEHHPKQMT